MIDKLLISSTLRFVNLAKLLYKDTMKHVFFNQLRKWVITFYDKIVRKFLEKVVVRKKPCFLQKGRPDLMHLDFFVWTTYNTSLMLH